MTGSPINTTARFVISLDYKPKAAGDCIPDDRMDEVVRRLIAVVPEDIENDIVRSEEPPQDRSKLWYVPSTKKLYVFNTSTSAWEETDVNEFTVCISPETDPALTKDELGCLLLDGSKLAGVTEMFEGDITSNGSGTATKSITLNEFEDSKASVEVVPLADLGADGRWWVSDQSATSVVVSFAGLTVSTDFPIRIVVRKTTSST